MAELTADTPLTPDAPTTSNSPRWLGSWKLWLLVMFALAIILFLTVAIPVLRIRAQWQIVNAIKSDSLHFSGQPVLPDWYQDLGNRLFLLTGAQAPSPESPVAAYAHYGTVSAETFDQLARLRLYRFDGQYAHFDVADIKRFAAASPELRIIDLHDSDSIPPDVQTSLCSRNPHLRIRETGTVFPGITVWPTPNGPQTMENSPSFRDLPVHAVITEMEGQPIESYHQIKDRGAELQPGEQLRFTVVDPPSKTDQEVIYTAPGPGKLLP